MDLASLIKQVRNNPHDRDLRLVLADVWLEQGNPQGQLMQWVSCLEDMDDNDPRYYEILSKCKSLQTQIAIELCINMDVDGVLFQHGYLFGLEVSKPAAWKSLRYLPIQEYALLTHVTLRLGSAPLGEWFTPVPPLPNITSLEITHSNSYGRYHGDLDAEWLLDTDYFKNIKNLNLNVFLGENGMSKLASSRYLGKLRALTLQYFGVDDVGVRQLASSPYLQNLTCLDLNHESIGRHGVNALATSRYLHNLEKMSLSGKSIDHIGATEIANFRLFSGLTSLHLGGTTIGWKGAKALASSPYLCNLSSLTLCGSHIGDRGVQALVKSPIVQHLHSLDVSYNEIGSDGIQELADSPYLNNLTSLDLTGNELGDFGVIALVNSPFFHKLTSFNYSEDALNWVSIKALEEVTCQKSTPTIDDELGWIRCSEPESQGDDELIPIGVMDGIANW
jgi:uncharacterized protein (TIGR02996 family)